MGMAFSTKSNVDDVFFRNVIVGALSYLKKKVTIWNQISDSQRQIVDVPFFFSATGDERYLQDAFLDWMDPDCAIKAAEGNYDPIPRGVLKYTGSSIRTDAMANPYVRSTYNKVVNGNIEAFSAYTEWFPITLTMDIEILVDSMLDTMKIQQQIIRNLYRTEPYVIYFEGFRILCQIQVPNENTVEKQFEFSFGETDQFTKINFTLEIETSLPSIRPGTEFNAAGSISELTSTGMLEDTEINDQVPIQIVGDRKNLL